MSYLILPVCTTSNSLMTIRFTDNLSELTKEFNMLTQSPLPIYTDELSVWWCKRAERPKHPLYKTFNVSWASVTSSENNRGFQDLWWTELILEQSFTDISTVCIDWGSSRSAVGCILSKGYKLKPKQDKTEIIQRIKGDIQKQRLHALSRNLNFGTIMQISHQKSL